MLHGTPSVLFAATTGCSHSLASYEQQILPVNQDDNELWFFGKQ
jgi:hypothetical protein